MSMRTSPNYDVYQSSPVKLLQQTSTANGRIDLFSPMPSLNIPAYQQRTVRNDSFASEATIGQLYTNDLSRTFFSEANIDALQQGIRYRIYVETGGKYTIGRQSDQELKIIMRSVYFQHSKNTNTDIIGQVRELNAKVLEWTVPEVLNNLKQYEIYRQDASMLPTPMDRPTLLTTKGSRSLEQKRWFD